MRPRRGDRASLRGAHSHRPDRPSRRLLRRRSAHAGGRRPPVAGAVRDPVGGCRMIDMSLLKRWGLLTTDANPLHTDPEYAASTRFGVPIAHGHLLACLAIEALDADAVSARFIAPVPVGSEIEVHAD